MAVKNLGRIVGLSAYEVWLEQGNTGTEQDYLNSLKGEQGEKGADGKTPVKNVDYFTEEDKQEIIDELAGQGSETPIYYIGNTYSTPFVFEGKKAGVYIAIDSQIYYQRSESSAKKSIKTLDGVITIFAEDDGTNMKPRFHYIENTGRRRVAGFMSGDDIYTESWSDTEVLIKNQTQTVSSVHTYTKLPESSVAPTTDNQFTNKAYVDNAITTAINNITNGDEVSY